MLIVQPNGSTGLGHQATEPEAGGKSKESLYKRRIGREIHILTGSQAERLIPAEANAEKNWKQRAFSIGIIAMFVLFAGLSIASGGSGALVGFAIFGLCALATSRHAIHYETSDPYRHWVHHKFRFE